MSTQYKNIKNDICLGEMRQFRRRSNRWVLIISRVGPFLRRELALPNMVRPVSEKSGFAHVRKIITGNYGYHITVGKLLY